LLGNLSWRLKPTQGCRTDDDDDDDDDRYRLDMPAVPVKNTFCIWEKISSSVRFHLFIVSVTRMATSMATDGASAFTLPRTPAVDLPR
jgi:hypothetical protein